ncbi:MAG: nucleotidyltransferase domain-containing protein [Verrucomicrobia bacterium]|nr:nucleotidyltransferase domain-containing protein [Verrucomicrobiota bacterium]
MRPDTEILDEMVRRIIAAADPLRIVLFGSAARDDMGPDIDLDVLVIVPDGTPRRITARKICRHLYGLGFAKDIVVATEQDIRDHGRNPSLVYQKALGQGRELYNVVEGISAI